MHYFSGLFDAEGTLSLCPNGAFPIGIEMTNEEIPNLFRDTFGGSIYTRKRDNRKKSWTWRINSIAEQALFFIDSISPFSVVKKPQLLRLRDYLDQPRASRKETRSITCSTIKNLKNPLPINRKIFFLPRTEKPVEPYFFEWFAGFFDGDGNFVCNEYLDNRNNKKYFSHQMSVANIYPEVICHIFDRIPGTITECKGTKNLLYKWTCIRSAEKFVCNSIHPFLKIKKNQCALFLEFLKFPEKTRNVDYSQEERMKMYAIINQIKHLNSL